MRRITILAATLATALIFGTVANAGMEENCVQMDDPELGIASCTAAITSGPWQGKALAWAYYNRGAHYGAIGKYRLAIEDYDEALRLDPSDAPAYTNRGIAYFRLGRPARAIEDYDAALRFDPGDAFAYDNRARVKCLLGHVEASVDDWLRALDLNAFSAEKAQQQLRDLGFYQGAVDGNFGRLSQEALQDWTAAGCPTTKE